MLASFDEKFDPAHSALLVVDMQNDFCRPGGFVDRIGGDLSGVDRAVPSIQALLAAARASGVPVVHICSWFDHRYLNEPMRERLVRFGVEPYCVEGTWGAEFIDELRPEAGEKVVAKHRYSAFYDTSLHTVLEGLGARSVVVCGTATNNCVDGTARDAFYRGYYVALPDDASCAPTDDLHRHALATAHHAYAVRGNVDDVVATWTAGAGARP
jgi:ureidoacrylate peracid hydrolase